MFICFPLDIKKKKSKKEKKTHKDEENESEVFIRNWRFLTGFWKMEKQQQRVADHWGRGDVGRALTCPPCFLSIHSQVLRKDIGGSVWRNWPSRITFRQRCCSTLPVKMPACCSSPFSVGTLTWYWAPACQRFSPAFSVLDVSSLQGSLDILKKAFP